MPELKDEFAEIKYIGRTIFGGVKLAGKLARVVYKAKIAPKVADWSEKLKEFVDENGAEKSEENKEAQEKAFWILAEERKQKYDEFIVAEYTHQQAVNEIAKQEKKEKK